MSSNVINKFLLVGDKFMPEIHLRQPQFTYSACGPFTKHEQRIQKFKETGDTNYIYMNQLDKACFTHDAACSDSKDLSERTVADKILKNKAFDIAKDPKYDGYQRGLASMNFINQLLENLKKLDFYYVLLIFLVNMLGLFL